MSYLLGIDVGGTFTDFSCFDTERGTLIHHKTSSTPWDPSEAIVRGIREILDIYGIRPEEIGYLAHGTTVATNALIQRRGGRTALITTKGFRDLLEIGRQTRPSLYEMDKVNADPLVPGDLNFEVTERILYDGRVYRPLDEGEVREVALKIKEKRVDAVAICTLFSFANPQHERRIAQIVAQECPQIYISTSSDLVPEFRESSRMSTTVVNAYLGPVMREYVNRFCRSIQSLGIETSPYVTQSNGSIISIQETISAPVRTALSGPSAGVVAACFIAEQCREPNIITFDMGGTSADISLIPGAQVQLSSEKKVEGYVIHIPMTDIETVGAGGGSIAYIDEGGALKVGPQSAGAQPGPAAYNRGGTLPTVTDANIILGRLNSERILGGRMEVCRELAEDAIRREICEKTGMDLVSAAKGIIAVVNSNMIRTTRLVSVERGYDVREFAMVSFGGAGPLHACEIAEELGIHMVIVPPSPGTFCSLGLLVADVKRDYVRTQICAAEPDNVETIGAIFNDLKNKGDEFLQNENVAAADRMYLFRIDARYQMQNYELTVPVGRYPFDEAALREAIDAFHEEHEKNYGHHHREQAVQFVNYRLTAIGKREKNNIRTYQPVNGNRKPVSYRKVCFNDSNGYVDCPVYDKQVLPGGMHIQGPAIIEQMDSTTVVLPKWEAEIQETGTLILRQEADR